jgi:hypothetical protein
MSGPRVLIIGAHCRKLNDLRFLREGLAERFHALMTKPRPGDCVGAEVADPPDRLLGPTVAEAEAAIVAAYDAAARDGDTLVLAYIGHGELFRGDFFVMPTDAASPPNPRIAIQLAHVIKFRPTAPAGGLIVLLDTCHSGAGAWNAAAYWVRSLRAATTPTPLTPATTSRAGPARRTTLRRRCSCSGSWCRTESECWAAITPTPSCGSGSGPFGTETSLMDAGTCVRDWRVPRAVSAWSTRLDGDSWTRFRLPGAASRADAPIRPGPD